MDSALATTFGILWICAIAVAWYALDLGTRLQAFAFREFAMTGLVPRANACDQRYFFLHNLWLLVLGAFVIRIVPAIVWARGDLFDIESFSIVAELVSARQDVYTNSAVVGHLARHPYLPLQMYLFAAADWIAHSFHLPFATTIKIVPILADAGIAGLVFRGALAQFQNPQLAFRLGLLYAFNPLSLLVVSYHGQFDSIPVFFALAAWLVLQREKSCGLDALVAGGLLGIAILDKSWPLIFLPILLQKAQTWRKRIAIAIPALAIPALGVWVYCLLFSADARQVVAVAASYQSIAGVWGWTQVGAMWSGSLLPVLDFTLYGKAFLFIALLVYYVCVSPKLPALSGMFNVVLLLFAAAPGLNVYYLMWLLPFALLTNAIGWTRLYIGLVFLWFAQFYLGLNPLPNLLPFERLALLLWLLTIGWLTMNLRKIPRPRIDPYLVLLVLFSLFAIGPLLSPGYFWGAHDGRHSVYFLFEFDRVIQDGILYPRWAPDFTFGYGYPFFNIYAPGAFYVGEALHLFGFDFVTATKIVFALAILLSGSAMFGFVKRLTGASQAAFLSGLVYVYIPYHIADIYVRAALAESFALIFLPLTLWGFYESVVNPRRTTIVAAAFAYGAMWFTHNGIALLFTPVLAIWVLFLMIGEFRKKPGISPSSLIPQGRFAVSHPTGRQIPRFWRETLRSLSSLGFPPLAALLLGLGLVAVFFLPMALEYQFVRVDQWTANYYDYSSHFVYLFQLFHPTWGFGISHPGPHDGMSFQFGVMPVLLSIFSIVAMVKDPNGTRRLWLFFLAMTIVVALLMLNASLPIWQALRLVIFAQFPWRLLTLTMVSLAVLAGAIALMDAPGQARGLSLPTLLLGVLILLGSYPYLTAPMQLEAKEGPVSLIGLMKFQQSAGEMTGSTAWVTEIPTWSDMADVWLAGKKVKTKAISTDYPPEVLWIGVLPNFTGMRTNGEQIVFHAKEDDLRITFNMFYYPGWRAYLTKPKTTEILRELPIETVGQQGKMQIRVPKGDEQWLLLRFDDTPPRIMGQWISALSVLLALGLLIWDVRTRRRAGVQGSKGAEGTLSPSPLLPRSCAGFEPTTK